MDDASTIDQCVWAIERFRRPEYDDEMFEIWFNHDPNFVEYKRNWGFFHGTEKDRLRHEVRLVLSAASEDNV